MKSAIQKPPANRSPRFKDTPYDYRNVENAGHFDGVGDPAKVGMKNATSIDPMPMKSYKTQVPRDHRG